MRKLILRITMIGIVLLGACADLGRDPPEVGVIAILVSPAEVKARIEERERLIAVEPRMEGLPRRLSFYLRTRQPDLSILSAEMADDDSRRLSMRYPGNLSPYACLGDFDGNGLEDAAVALIDKSGNRLRLMAFHQTRVSRNPGDFEDRGYRAIDIVEPGPIPSEDGLAQVLILCQPPGEYESFEGDVAVRLRNDSLSIGWSLYFFIDGAYLSMAVTD